MLQALLSFSFLFYKLPHNLALKRCGGMSQSPHKVVASGQCTGNWAWVEGPSFRLTSFHSFSHLPVALVAWGTHSPGSPSAPLPKASLSARYASEFSE